MSMSNVIAVVLFFGVTAYAVFGGADFGAGFWDLIAGGAERGARPRAVAAHSIGPVWEANHVWLIFCLVVLWTGFPEAYAVDRAHAVRAALARRVGHRAPGLELRVPQGSHAHLERRNFGAAFAVSSLIVPFCLGAVAGAIASGRVPAGGKAGDPWDSWINPTSILGGVLAIAVCAYLASVYLFFDARRFDDAEMVEYFRRAGSDRRDRHRRDRGRRRVRAARRRAVHLRRAHVTRAAARDHLGDLRDRLDRAVAPQLAPLRSRARDRRGRVHRDRLGRRAVAVHASRPR